MELIDTHCHIHDSEFAENSSLSTDELINRAKEEGVSKLICVGTSLKSSKEARIFAENNSNCYFSVALHPHEAGSFTLKELSQQMEEIEDLISKNPTRFVAVGECGLDYFYHNDNDVLSRQEFIFRKHIDIALKYKKPIIFHIRSSEKKDTKNEVSDAFRDFFSIVDEYQGVTGVVHSFSASSKELEAVLSRGLFVGLNGIMTFTKDVSQLTAAREVPVEKLLLETDAPFLTPRPFRGTMNEPKHVINITKFLSELRGESQAFLAKQTTENAIKLFKL